MEEQTVVTLEQPGYPMEVLARLSSRDAAEAWHRLNPGPAGRFQFVRFRYPFQASEQKN